MKATNILWDVYDEEILRTLPSEIEIPEGMTNNDDEISDYLSDLTGYCHCGFRLVKNKEVNNKTGTTSKELLKFNKTQSLVARIKEDGTIHEYVVCSNYNANAPEGSKWDWGHYFVDMEGALQYIATRCFSPIRKYVLIETDANNNIEEKIFDTYTEARKEFDAKFYDYAAYDDCHHSKVYDDGNGNPIGELWFFNEPDVELKIIEVVV